MRRGEAPSLGRGAPLIEHGQRRGSFFVGTVTSILGCTSYICAVNFIEPCNPTASTRPPIGYAWCHEFKFDGYRVQLHKQGEAVIVYSRRGADFTRRAGREVVATARTLNCESCVLDGELVAIGDDGKASFRALHMRSGGGLAVIAFDLLELDGEDLRAKSLLERRRRLAKLFPVAGSIALSETFEDPYAMLAACEREGLEGIVSKRLDRPYRSGPSRGEWIKVKTDVWRAANQERHLLFERKR